MKTKQEQIEEIMETLLAHQPIIDVPYEQINDIAIALVQEGYGNISEYKAEIERLEEKYEELRDEMPDKIKQTQIDILNKAKKKLNSAPNGWAYTGYIDDLIEEVAE